MLPLSIVDLLRQRKQNKATKLNCQFYMPLKPSIAVLDAPLSEPFSEKEYSKAK